MNKDIEIHCLICKRDLLYAINNFKSLRKYEEFVDMPIYFHEDGSLVAEDKELLLSSFPNAIFIDRKWADKEIEQYLVNHPHCHSYRLGSNPINLWHKIKSFDYFFFSKSKKVLGMDTDLLFLHKPESMIAFLNSDTPFYFPDIQGAYCFNEPKDEIPVIDKVNTGLIYIPGPEYYSLDDLEHALSNLLRNGVNYFPSWIEQSAFAHMFYKNGKYKTLDERKYRIPYFQPVDMAHVEGLHFVSYPAVRETYDNYLNYIKLDNGTVVYQNSYVVEFDAKKIPMSISVSAFEGIYRVAYTWELEKAGQQFLDHIYTIKSDGVDLVTHKCQSEKQGFFFVSGKYKKFEVHHTFEWYGRTDWKHIDTISLGT